MVASSKDTIHVYNTITFKTVHTLKGHQGEVTSIIIIIIIIVIIIIIIKVTSIQWSQDDLKLVSCADNGSVYEWNVATGERVHEVVVKTCSFSYLTLSPDSENIYAVGSDRTMKQLVKSAVQQEIDLHSFQLSSVCLSPNGKVLVAGSTTGAVQLFDFPLSLPGKWREWKLHGDQVNFIKISHTNDILVTASLDGSFAIWDIKMLEDKTKEVEPYTFAVEILITKSELEEKNNLIEDLKQKVDESKTECAYQLRLKVILVLFCASFPCVLFIYFSQDNQNEELMREVKKEALEEKKNSKAKITALERDIEEQKKARAAEVERDKKETEQTLIDQSDMYKAKLVVEYEKFEKLQEEFELMKVSSVEKVKLLESSIENKVLKIKDEFNLKLSVYEGEVKEREKVNEEKVKSMEEILKQTEEDADKEILEIKTRYESELKMERETLVRVRGELGILKKKYSGSQKEMESQKGNIDWMNKEQGRLKTDIKNNEKDKVELKKEMKGRDMTILDKEKEITQLKKEMRQMENTRFDLIPWLPTIVQMYFTRYVLSHKIKVLQDEIKPKEDRIEVVCDGILGLVLASTLLR